VSLEFRPLSDGDEVAFRDLNEAWIGPIFGMEPEDYKILSDPVTHILNPGGHVLMALEDGTAVGCCALLAMGDGTFELSKMAVHESRRGAGLGRKLIEYAIAHARGIGAKRLYLETSTKLPNAVHLYESTGFRHVPEGSVRDSPYRRSDVFMAMWL